MNDVSDVAAELLWIGGPIELSRIASMAEAYRARLVVPYDKPAAAPDVEPGDEAIPVITHRNLDDPSAMLNSTAELRVRFSRLYAVVTRRLPRLSPRAGPDRDRSAA
jgi:hypothetical protein